MNPETVDVTAGLGGFLAFFLLAVALYFLMRNMTARLRRMAYRQEQELGHEQEQEEEKEQVAETADRPPRETPDSARREGGSREGQDLV